MADTEAAQEQFDEVRVQSVGTQPVPTENPLLKQQEEQFICDPLIVARPPTQENRMSKSPKL